MDILPITREFIDYWHSMPKGKHGIPTKESLKLHRIPKAMPHVLLLDLEEKNQQYFTHILFAGSAKCDLFKAEMTGLNLLFLFEKDVKAAIYHRLQQVLNHPSGFWLQSLTPYERGISTLDEVTALPIYDESLGRSIICMLSYAQLATTHEAIDIENGKAQLITPDHWIDIGYGIPEGRQPLLIP